tara:strand:+ start:1021 stop:1269 length:249 start_codon:yes stop_codon:yes gene_type:complete
MNNMKWFNDLNFQEKKQAFDFCKKCFLEGFSNSNYEYNNEVADLPEHLIESELITTPLKDDKHLVSEFEKYFLNSANGNKTV